MNFRKILPGMLAAAATLALTACCSTPQIKESGTTLAADAFKPYVESGELPGAISIFYKPDVYEIACSGWADVDKKIPMSMDRMFMQCSQTKGFCGVTIAMLVEEGKISLDDPVAKYLPYFKDLKVGVRDEKGKLLSSAPAKNVLTIRMVMNHTGGFNFEIPTKAKKGWPGLSLQETAKEAASIPLLFEPGTKMRYSNTGIDIGAAIIEVVTGKPWDVFLKERLFDPLEMKDATFNPTEEQLSRAISMYDVKAGEKAQFRLFNRAMPLPHNGPDVHPSAGAGLWLTPADQVKFYKMLMNLGVGDNGARILQEKTVKDLLMTNSRPEGLGLYSLGLGVNPDGSVGHGGAWGTNAMVNWKTKQLRMLIVQLNGQPRPWGGPWYKAAEKFFSSKIDDSTVNAYTGRLQ